MERGYHALPTFNFSLPTLNSPRIDTPNQNITIAIVPLNTSRYP